MTRSRLTRRRIAGTALAVSLTAGVLLPLMAHAAGCPSWTDIKGDSTTDESGVEELYDSNLDIVAAALGTVGDSLVGTITTEGLNANSSDFGDEFAFFFTLAGQSMTFYVDRARFQGQTVDQTSGIYNSTGSVGGVATATFDVPKKTVTLTAKLTEVAKAATKPVVGQPISGLRAQTSNQIQELVITVYDTAATPLKPVVGEACEMGGAPGPAPAPSGSASAAPSASPSASASATPSATPSASGSAAPGGAQQATAGCGLKDDKGDANPQLAGGQGTGNEPDLDIINLAFRTDAENLSAHLKLDKLAAKPAFALASGHRFIVGFTHNKKVLSLQSTAPGAGTGLVDGTANADLKVTAVHDVASSQVIISVPRAAIEKVAAAALPGATVLTGVNAATEMRFGENNLKAAADTAQAAKAEERIYAVGDNSCFAAAGPSTAPSGSPTASSSAAPTGLTLAAASSGQYGDVQTVTATLKNQANNTPVAGKTITASLSGGKTGSAKTNSQGVASIRIPVTRNAGKTTLTAKFPGDATAAASSASKAFTVVVEKTVLRATGSKGTITATLTDDDKPATKMSGRIVTFTYSGKKVNVRTDRNGVAKLSKIKAGTTVKVTYAGVKSQYAASSATAKA